MTIATQLPFGEIADPVTEGGLLAKAEDILERFPETRNSYRLFILRFWTEFDGLTDVLGDKMPAFEKWFLNARRSTAPRTAWNRCWDVQQGRPDLRPSPAIEKLRQKQAKGGRVLR